MTIDIAPGVRCVATTRRDNAFLLDGDDGYTLVDVGWASAPHTPGHIALHYEPGNTLLVGDAIFNRGNRRVRTACRVWAVAEREPKA